MRNMQKGCRNMISKEFIDKYGVNLVVEHSKTNIIFKTDVKNIKNKYDVQLCFIESVAKELTEYLEYISKQIWNDFNPKIANSISSDYAEYYDRKYDNEGYLSIFKENVIKIERPDENCPYMYKFNKKRMESFIYDLKK